MHICLLASGSKGNATYIANRRTSILIDAGLSGKQIEKRMARRALDPKSLDAILVTHEHNDHIRGVGVLARRYDLPVFITRETWQSACRQIGKINKQHFITCGQPFNIDGLAIHPFALSHDAADPTGFTITCGQCKIGMATDLGVVTNLVREHLREAHLLVIEANHDPEMLLHGPYPWALKQRISSRMGHLSNSDAQKLITELKGDHLKYVILAHLSETNNTPEKAYKEVCIALEKTMTELRVTTQEACGPLIHLSPNIA